MRRKDVKTSNDKPGIPNTDWQPVPTFFAKMK